MSSLKGAHAERNDEIFLDILSLSVKEMSLGSWVNKTRIQKELKEKMNFLLN